MQANESFASRMGYLRKFRFDHYRTPYSLVSVADDPARVPPENKRNVIIIGASRQLSVRQLSAHPRDNFV